MKKLFVVIFFCSFSFFLFCASHEVLKGETLYSISRKHGISVAELCSANNMTEKDTLKVGQKLTIPGKTVVKTAIYTVAKGDTFYSIARRYEISVDELLKLNNLTSEDTLKIGQKLKVPAKEVIATVKTDTSVKNNSSKMELTDPRNYSNKKGDSTLLWPVNNPKVVYVTGKVSGVQLSAEKNEAVKAVHSGTVMFSGLYRGFGKVVFVQSQTGHMYVYTGLNDIYVNKSDYVSSGEKLGTVGIDALSGKPQLTFMVFQNGRPIDPAKAPRS